MTAHNAIPVTFERLKAKFFASVDQCESEEKCWNWTGPKHTNGYARLAVGKSGGPNFFVDSGHRFSWKLFQGEIPEGMQINHRCDNRRCVNPSHLFLGTQMDNMRDKIAKGRASCGEKHSLATKIKTPRGSQNPTAKLVEADIPQILELAKAGKFQREIAAQFGVSKTAIGYILRGRNWKHLTSELQERAGCGSI